MRIGIKGFGIFALAVAAPAYMHAQVPNPTTAPPPPVPAPSQTTYDNTPLYRIQVVGRDIPAINYFQRKGVTEIGFTGTSLLPEAHGEARVEATPGRTSIRASFDHLTPANSFGPEYLTYVLWAITPEGRPINLGEVLPGKNGKDEITVTTNLEAFGLIVTAEPYFAVTMPSDVVVAQNEVLHGKTQGGIEDVNVHYSLLPRGAYEETAGRHEVLHPIRTDERSPLELYEAENAVQIAEAGGADQYAADTMTTAKQALTNAEDYDKHKRDRRQTITYAREAVQTAEDARIITIRKLRAADELAQQQARARAEQAAAQAQQTAAQEAAARAQAEQAAQQARQEQEQAQAAAAQAQQEQQQAQQQAAAARLQEQQAEAQAAAARQQQLQAEQQTQQLAQQVEQARERLRQQLGQVLQTRETARGLIMSMSDVEFGFNKYDLKPDAKVKLAKISGILLAYPDLKVQVNGYTDNIGSASYNQKLSEERAGAVRDFLISQNVPAANVTSQGFGDSNPVADNSTSAGRAQNRRVELVVSGAAIGIGGGQQPGTENQTPAGAPPANPGAAPGTNPPPAGPATTPGTNPAPPQ